MRVLEYVTVLVLIVLCSVAGCGGTDAMPESSRVSSGFHVVAQLPGISDEVKEQIRKKLQESLEWADRESQRRIDGCLQGPQDFFVAAKENSAKFAEVALAWKSKWTSLVDKVPFTNGQRNNTYLREQFQQIIFEERQLVAVLEQAVNTYWKDIESIDGDFLVRISKDMENLPMDTAIREEIVSHLIQPIRKTVAESIDAGTSSASGEVAREILQELLIAVAGRLGISAGIVTAGASVSWSSAGMSVIAAVVIDYVVSRIWNWYADPVGVLRDEIERNLDEVQRLVVEGDLSKDPQIIGLRYQLLNVAAERNELRMRHVYGR